MVTFPLFTCFLLLLLFSSLTNALRLPRFNLPFTAPPSKRLDAPLTSSVYHNIPPPPPHIDRASWDPVVGQASGSHASVVNKQNRTASKRTSPPMSKRRPTDITIPDTWYISRAYQGEHFFDDWSFATYSDPTYGQVQYISKEWAMVTNMSYINEAGQAVMQVDNWSWLAPGQARNSIRIESNDLFNKGLYILDVAAAPWGLVSFVHNLPSFTTRNIHKHGSCFRSVLKMWCLACMVDCVRLLILGPSFTLSPNQLAHHTLMFFFYVRGPYWPAGGEIDIMEGVHDNVHNQVTYHTSENCYLVPPTSTTPLAQNLTGWVTTTDCYAYSPDVGCAVIDPSVASYGTQFNILGGGVFAMMWLDDSVRVWFFHRSSIPPDIQTNSPKPSTWGTPTSFLGNGCDIPSHFWNHQLVFDITFCGVWAGSSYVSSGCPGTCSERVQQPSNFVNASWTINYVHVFGSPGISGGNVTSSAPATRPSGSSTIIKLLTFGIGALGIQTLYTL